MSVASVDPVSQFRLFAMFSLLSIKVKLPLFLIKYHAIYKFPIKEYPLNFQRAFSTNRLLVNKIIKIDIYSVQSHSTKV